MPISRDGIPSRPPLPRAVLLGASNVTRGISTVVGAATAILGSPLEIVAAMGHGRSYGRRSRVLARSLPGIADSGLWPALREMPAAATWALVTDIGNDIVYGAAVAEIAGWVESCLAALGDLGARTVVTTLPMESLAALGPRRFRAARAVLFPGRPLGFDDARDRAAQLDERIAAIARDHGAALVPLPGRWYGLDPVHIRMGCRAEAWSTILAAWREDGTAATGVRAAPGRWLRLRTAMPERYSMFGIERTARQPVRTLADGSRVWLF